MQLVILIIVNIALATVFYLVISLKLEKNASEYREKKFRREMDEVIREFNNTAERNISLLEHKINVMKKLLRESGQLSSLDVTLGETKEEEDQEPGIADSPVETIDTAEKSEKKPVNKTFSSLIADGLDSFKNMVHNVTTVNKSKTEETESNNEYTEKQEISENIINNKGSSLDITLEKDFSSLFSSSNETVMDNEPVPIVEDESSAVDGKELEEMFNGAGDKYGLAADLYKKGYPLDILAKSSGIPLGELKLILNLSTSL